MGSRISHGFVALLALTGIVLEYAALVSSHPASELPWRTVNFFSFFTILTNSLVAAAAIGAALAAGRWHDWATRPSVRTAVSVYILVVAAIYQALLAGLHPLSPVGWWGNMLVHRASPAGWLLCWLAFAPHGGIDTKAPLRWLVYPLGYGAWMIVHGLATGWYPYPFVDVVKLGGAIVARNMLLNGLFFFALGWLFRWLDGRLVARSAA